MSWFRSQGWLRIGPWLALAAAALAGAAGRYLLAESLTPRSFSYFIESCFRFRYAEMRMLGEEPPALDRPAQWPEGFRYDRMILPLPERVAAAVYRAGSARGDTFLATRRTTLIFMALGPVFFAPLALAALRRPRRAALATLFYALLFAAFGRSVGNFLQEDFAWPGLLLATAAALYLLTWEGRGWRKWGALAAGAGAAAWACSCWHMSQFYLALVAVLVVAAAAAGKTRPAALAGLMLFSGLALAAVLNKPLWIKGALWGTAPALALAPALGWLGARVLKKESCGRWLAPAAAVVLGALATAFGRAADYNHVFALMWAKVIHFGIKPDPAKLPADARLFWVGPYNSPPFLVVWMQYGLTLLAAAAGWVLWGRDTLKRRLPDGWLVAAAAAGTAILYLLISRLTIFFAPWAAIAAAYLIARGATTRARVALAIPVLLAWGFHVYGTANNYRADVWYRPTLDRLVKPALEIPWYYGSERGELMAWLDRDAKPGALLCDFSAAPPFLYILKRPIVLHPMFEVPEIRIKTLAYVDAALADEETFYRRCRDWRVRYVIHFAPQVLTHGAGSFYSNSGLDPEDGSAAWAMQFGPERMRRFRLVFESYSVRVFEVGAPYDGFRARAYHPLFDRDFFPVIPPADEVNEFYRDYYRADAFYQGGLALAEAGNYVAAAACFKRVLLLHPDYEDANLRLAVSLMALGRAGEARRFVERALTVRPGDAVALECLTMIDRSNYRPPGR